MCVCGCGWVTAYLTPCSVIIHIILFYLRYFTTQCDNVFLYPEAIHYNYKISCFVRYCFFSSVMYVVCCPNLITSFKLSPRSAVSINRCQFVTIRQLTSCLCRQSRGAGPPSPCPPTSTPFPSRGRTPPSPTAAPRRPAASRPPPCWVRSTSTSTRRRRTPTPPSPVCPPSPSGPTTASRKTSWSRTLGVNPPSVSFPASQSHSQQYWMNSLSIETWSLSFTFDPTTATESSESSSQCTSSESVTGLSTPTIPAATSGSALDSFNNNEASPFLCSSTPPSSNGSPLIFQKEEDLQPPGTKFITAVSPNISSAAAEISRLST